MAKGRIPPASPAHAFTPDWTIAPGETLRAWMTTNHVTPGFIAACSGADAGQAALALITDVLDHRPLSDDHALALERGTFVPARIWLALEHNYRAALAAGLTDISEPS